MIRNRLFFLFFFLLFLLPLAAVELTPTIRNFSKKEYRAFSQNWAIAQDSDGYLYIGNSAGLLRYDGLRWELFRLPGNKLVRSVYIDANDRIYVGAYEEFGFFEKERTGSLSYHSLSDELYGYAMKNDEVWSILQSGDTVCFQSFNSYFTFSDKKVRGERLPKMALFFRKLPQGIFSYFINEGFSGFDMQRNQYSPVQGVPSSHSVIEMLNLNDSVNLLLTVNDGLFLFDGTQYRAFPSEADPILKRANANRMTITQDSVVIIGTILDGLVAVNMKGEQLWHLNTGSGLPNNTVLGLFNDSDNNTWVALDKGITRLNTGKQLSIAGPFDPAVGMIYDVALFENNLYLATNQGLYRSKFVRKKNRPVEVDPVLFGNLREQVWSLTPVDEQLIVGHNTKTYSVRNGEMDLFSEIGGGYSVTEGKIEGQDVLIQGTYSGLCLYKKDENGNWFFSNMVEGYNYPTRFVEIDYQGTIWCSHLYKGLYAVRLTPDLKKLSDLDYYASFSDKSSITLNVFKIKNRVVFCDYDKFYTFNDLTEEMVALTDLNDALGGFSKSYRVSKCDENHYWFIRNDRAALISIENSSLKFVDVINYNLFNQEAVDNFNQICPVDSGYSIFCFDNAFALHHPEQGYSRRGETPKLLLKRIEVSDNAKTNIVLADLSSSVMHRFESNRNRISFSVAVPELPVVGPARFVYTLKSSKVSYSDTLNTNEYELIDLNPGEYTFNVSLIRPRGKELASVSYSFEIQAPWYLSLPAQVFYLILAVCIFCAVYVMLRRNYDKRKKRFLEEQEIIRHKELEEQERQIIRLEKERLESELALKSKELAGITMSIISKNEILQHIKDELVAQKTALGQQYPTRYYEKVIHLINANMSSNNDWEVFKANFDRIHENFFRILHDRYPELTSNDLRLCAYIRLNMPSKDIAQLMNVSLKAVEVGRYRLRKKLNIPTEKSLFDFMLEI